MIYVYNICNYLVNQLEEAYDDFMERRLGEKQETHSELHWSILGMVLSLAQSPTNAHQIENPVSQVKINFQIFKRVEF